MSARRESLGQGAQKINKTARTQMKNPNIFWYALLVRSGKEFLAQRISQQGGAYVYLPLCWKWRRLNRYKREKSKLAYPALPGCLFIGFESGKEEWLCLVRSVTSLRGLLGCFGMPLALRGERLSFFIESNFMRFDVPQEERYMRTHHEFQAGDQVQITSGPLVGYIVDVQKISGKYAFIFNEICHETKISLDKLEKIDYNIKHNDVTRICACPTDPDGFEGVKSRSCEGRVSSK
ncbi:MAG: transcription termination/antitermination NusG family protein [Alphaproteobacteria bacterium]|nr:transcription termination/antitermination NusG family protein [Alphaproteobacteria bacterium]